MATTHPLDGTEPSSSAGGRPPALTPEHIAILHNIVMERAQSSVQEIADELHHRCGLRVCTATIRRARRALGILRLKPARRACAVRAEGTKRYGYTAAHRREAISPYSTNLTDAQWTWLRICSSVCRDSEARPCITADMGKARTLESVHSCLMRYCWVLQGRIQGPGMFVDDRATPPSAG